jgi:hypothetical protein
MVIDGITLRNVELSVTDREHMEYNILLGRKTLSAGGFLVNPAAGILDNGEESAPTPAKESNNDEEEDKDSQQKKEEE